LFCSEEYAYVTDEVYLYRSSDGLKWEKFPSGGIDYLTTYKSTLVALFSIYSKFSSDEEFLKISYDNGEHWKEIPKPLNEVDYHTMILLGHGLYIIDQTKTKLLFTTNEGLNWEEKSLPINSIAQLNSLNENIFIHDEVSLWHSDETGNNWMKIEFPTPIEIFQFIVNDSLMIAAVKDGLYHSYDSGKIWSFYSLDWSFYFPILPTFELNGIYLYLTFEGSGFGRSTDFFETERIDLNVGKKLPLISKLKTFKGKLLAQTYGWGIHYWDENNLTLVESNKGMGTPAIWHTGNTANYLWTGTPNRVYGYDLNQKMWTIDTKLPTPSKNFNFVSGNENGWIVSFSDTSKGHFYFSDDEGQNWRDVQVGNTYGRRQMKWVTMLDDILFVYYSDSTWRSDDRGQNWQPLPLKFITQIVKYKNQYYTAIRNKLYTSIDQGMNWDSIYDFKDAFMEGIEAGNDFLLATIDPDGTEPRFNYSVYKSIDGIDWHKADIGLPPDTVKFSFGFRRQSNKILFEYRKSYLLNLGATGLYMAQDSSLNWLKLEDGYQFTNYHIIDSTVFGGTLKQGIYRASLNNIITKNNDPKFLTDKNEISVYPNPFETKVHLQLNDDEHSTIFIYNQSGQKLKQLFCTSKSLELDLSNLNSGIYFFQFLNKRGQQIRKIIKN